MAENLDDCVALIMVLYERNFLKKPIKRDQLNSFFGKSTKPFFEERYRLRFTKQKLIYFKRTELDEWMLTGQIKTRDRLTQMQARM